MKPHNNFFLKHRFIISFCSVLIIHNASAQSATDTTYKYLNRLAASDAADDKKLLTGKLDSMAVSNNEKDVSTAIQFYYKINKIKTADSLQNLEITKFPEGTAARNKRVEAVYREKNPAAEEKLFNEWLTKFPPSRFPNLNHDHVIYDYARAYTADLFAEQDNVEKAEKYIGTLEENFWKGNAYAGLSAAFQKAGDLKQAEIYAQKGMISARSFLNAKDGAGRFAASGYPGLCKTYVNILYEEKKYDTALSYIDTVYQLNKPVDPSVNYLYAELLIKAGRKKEAFDKMDEAMKTGKATPEMTDIFKNLYIDTKGSDKGYNEYMASVNRKVNDELRADLEKTIMNKKAPLFTLTDLKGNTVSLAQLKGKTVILDFWATWCGPCKRSFPAMQMALNKFKKDTAVQFLFIHTWERNDSATAEAESYIKEHHYDFEVLMDLKDSITKQNKVVSSYGVQGIPAKFVIDPQGNIRFQLTGFDGSNEQAVNEISMMIDMARNKKYL